MEQESISGKLDFGSHQF